MGTESPVIVVSPKYLNELKRLPDDVLSFAKAIDEVSVLGLSSHTITSS